MSDYAANSLLFLLLSMDRMNRTSGKRLHMKCVSAKHCGFLIHPRGSESRSRNQRRRVLVIWNCILLLVIEKFAPLVSLKTLHVAIIGLEKPLGDSEPIQLFEAIPQG